MTISAVDIFVKELEEIKQEDVKVFAHNALVSAPTSFISEQNTDHTKKVFYVVKSLIEMDGVTGPIRDVILTGALLSDIADQYLSEELNELHPVVAKTLLKPLADDLHAGLFEGIIRIVESHEGQNTPSKLLEPKPGSPEHLVAMAHRLVRNESIHIEVKS